jgi:hypothetical protein
MYRPGAAPSGQPLYIETVLREHVDRATELLALLRSACLEGTGPDSLDEPWARAESNIDALRLDRSAAIDAALGAIPDDPDVASVAALLLAECGLSDAASRVTTLLRDPDCDVRDATWWGLRLADIETIANELCVLATQPVDDYATATARDCLVFHRRSVVVPVAATFDALPEDVAWLTAEARGRSGAWDTALLARLASHPSPAVKGTALKNAARGGFRGVLDFCRSAPDQASMRSCIEFLGVVGNQDDLPRLQRLATGADAELAPSAIAALGTLGLVAALPTLLYLLDEPKLAEAAASAIERITGEQVPRGAAPVPPENLSEEELDLWEAEAPIDVGATREWWSSRAPHFDPSKRYQVGVNVTDDALGVAFDQLPQRLRRAVYLRERAFAKDAPDWELDTWPRRQRNPSA